MDSDAARYGFWPAVQSCVENLDQDRWQSATKGGKMGWRSKSRVRGWPKAATANQRRFPHILKC
jgi:hypothetical protein